MNKLAFGLGAACAAITGAGTLALAFASPPSRQAALIACTERVRDIDPVLRGETCRCVAEKLSSWMAVIRNGVHRGDVSYATLTTNICRARAYGLIDPVQGNRPG